MSGNNGFAELFKDAQQRDSYWSELAALGFVSDLTDLLQRRGMSQADLARELDSSPAYVTKVLRGNVNLTVKSMVKFSRAVGGRLHIHVADERHNVRWLDVIDGRGKRAPKWKRDDYTTIQPNRVSVSNGEATA